MQDSLKKLLEGKLSESKGNRKLKMVKLYGDDYETQAKVDNEPVKVNMLCCYSFIKRTHQNAKKSYLKKLKIFRIFKGLTSMYLLNFKSFDKICL